MIYQETNSTITRLMTDNFRLEKDLQKFVEKNLDEIFGFKFIETEFTVQNYRLDTLAYDPETKSFQIIEYKKVKNRSLVDQGYAYLNTMIDRQAEFVLKYNEKTGESRPVRYFDWSQSRVIFVSPEYTQYQKDATNRKSMPIRLFTINRYKNGIVSIDEVQKTTRINENEDIRTDESVPIEVKVYTEEDHISGKPDAIVELYNEYKDRLLDMEGISDVEAKKKYISFRSKYDKPICGLIIQSQSIKIVINAKYGTIKDPLGLTTNMSSTGHWATGDYQVIVSDDSNIEDVLTLIRQAVAMVDR
jgi:predicted transport protein